MGEPAGTLLVRTSKRPLLYSTKSASDCLGSFGSVFAIVLIVSSHSSQKLARSWVLPPIRKTAGTPARSATFWSSCLENSFGFPKSPKYDTAASNLRHRQLHAAVEGAKALLDGETHKLFVEWRCAFRGGIDVECNGCVIRCASRDWRCTSQRRSN